MPSAALAQALADLGLESLAKTPADVVNVLVIDQFEEVFTQSESNERDAICEVHSGAGGTDSQDWAAMLLRMFTRWAQAKDFSVEVDEMQEGQEAGITSATRS